MEFIHSDQAPPAVGPYSQAVAANGFVFCSGQLPLVPGTKDFAGTDIASQADQVLKNLSAVLEAAGSSLRHVVKCTVFMQDLADFAGMNEVYARHFGDHKPARSTFQVAALPLGARIEIECFAVTKP